MQLSRISIFCIYTYVVYRCNHPGSTALAGYVVFKKPSLSLFLIFLHISCSNIYSYSPARRNNSFSPSSYSTSHFAESILLKYSSAVCVIVSWLVEINYSNHTGWESRTTNPCRRILE